MADRYSYSGIVYTISKDGAPDWEWCLSTEECLPQPDLILCLVPEQVDDLTRRGGYGDERFDTASFQDRVAANYKRLAEVIEKKRQDAGGRGPLWKWIAIGKMSIEEVHSVILENVSLIVPK